MSWRTGGAEGGAACHRSAPCGAESRPESTLEQIETYLARIDGPADPEEFDGYVKRRLHDRRELLVRWSAHRPSDGMCARAEELVRSATLALGCKAGRVPDLTRITAYGRGYRSVVSLPDAAIVDAADRRWWSNLTGLWPL